MKSAIHLSRGGFSDIWIVYCRKQDIPFKKLNCYHTNIVQNLHDCNALMWHHNHAKRIGVNGRRVAESHFNKDIQAK